MLCLAALLLMGFAPRKVEDALPAYAKAYDAAFRALFSKSPVKRIGRDRFVRNVLIAIGNSDDVALAPEAVRLLDDASPLVRGAAAWALSQLMDITPFAALGAKAMDAEHDEGVRKEWTAALAGCGVSA